MIKTSGRSRVVVPYTHLHPATESALTEHAPHAERVHLDPADIEAYWRLLSAEWDRPGDVVIVEHDNVLPAAALAGFDECERTNCAHWYEFLTDRGPGTSGALGCTRFREAAKPALREAFAALPSSRRHWQLLHTLVDQTLRAAGHAQHRHTPDSPHHYVQPGDGPFTFTASSGAKIVLPAMTADSAGVAFWDAVEQLADADTLAQIDELPAAELSVLAAAWAGRSTEHAAAAVGASVQSPGRVTAEQFLDSRSGREHKSLEDKSFMLPPDPEAPVLIENALSDRQIGDLLAYVEKYRHDPVTRSVRPPSIRHLAEQPEWVSIAGALCKQLADHYGLGVNGAVPHLAMYGEGEYIAAHCDSSGASAQHHQRTVSFSVALNEPGVDYTGGEFVAQWNDQVTTMTLPRGTLVGFTARTPHEVLPVKSGERIVLVCFGYDLPERRGADDA